jgi:apolipoprotein N-acyltransferase
MRLNRVIPSIVAPVLSSTLLALAFPAYNLSAIAYFGLMPMLFELLRRKPVGAFFSAYLFGILYFALVFTWMFTVPKYVAIHHAFLAFYLGLYIGTFGLAFNLIARAYGGPVALLTAPAIWVMSEFVRANMGFLSHPGAFLAHSQYQNIRLIQFAAITGVYGISFAIVLVNAALVSVILNWVPNDMFKSSQSNIRTSGRSAAVVVTICCTVILIMLAYGNSVVRTPLQGPEYQVALIQANIEQERKWDPKYARSIMKAYKEMTLQAAVHAPDLIIWPEAATPGAITQNKRLLKYVSDIAGEADNNLLIGSTSHNKYDGAGSPRKLNYFNSAFLIQPANDVSALQRYDKIHLLPFGEYLPKNNIVPWHLIQVPTIDTFIAGDQYVVFELPSFKFSTIICWESIFPGMARQFVKNGAQFLVNISNEGWFGESAGPYHFLIMSLFRAVENRTYLVRCANTGVSCVIDPFGRIVNRIQNSTGKDIFVQGILMESIVPARDLTVYTRVGDVFAVACSMVVSAALIGAVIRKVFNRNQR